MTLADLNSTTHPFEISPLADGTPRWLAEEPGGIIEAFGSKTALTKVSLVVVWASNSYSLDHPEDANEHETNVSNTLRRFVSAVFKGDTTDILLWMFDQRKYKSARKVFSGVEIKTKTIADSKSRTVHYTLTLP